MIDANRKPGRDFNDLRPEMQRWEVSPRIFAHDKGGKINQWHIHQIPGVMTAIERYINDYWRPLYEEWDQGRLKELFLFPPAMLPNRICRSKKQNVCAVRNMIQNVLGRAGIPAIRAHPHAFRKGVVTELLRAGNPIKVVSLFVHHQSVSTTERSYDKRKAEELLDKMVLPLGWERAMENINSATCQETLADEEAVAVSSVTDSIDRERVGVMKGMMEAIQTMHQQKIRIDILKSILTVDLSAQYQDLCIQRGISP